jgi:hypothetical protein
VSHASPRLDGSCSCERSIAKLFEQRTWYQSGELKTIIRPQALIARHSHVFIDHSIGREGLHASAALADFYQNGEDWLWNGSAGAPFRIPQYDGFLWPDLDSPVAADNVIREPQPRHPSSYLSKRTARPHSRGSSLLLASCLGSSPRRSLARLSSQRSQTLRLSKSQAPGQRLSTDSGSSLQGMSEMTVEELKRRLSHLIGRSFEEFDVFFDGF